MMMKRKRMIRIWNFQRSTYNFAVPTQVQSTLTTTLILITLMPKTRWLILTMSCSISMIKEITKKEFELINKIIFVEIIEVKAME